MWDSGRGRHHCMYCSVMLLCSFYVSFMWHMLLWFACSSDQCPQLWVLWRFPSAFVLPYCPPFCEIIDIHNLCAMNISITYLLDNHGKEHLRCHDVQCHNIFGLHRAKVSCQGHRRKWTFVVDNPSLGNTYIFRWVVTFSSMLLACHSNNKINLKVQRLSQVQPSCRSRVYVQYTHITNIRSSNCIPHPHFSFITLTIVVNSTHMLVLAIQ